jgi:ribose 5-phosphate isomerase RpiB
MKIAIINEISAADKNRDIVQALKKFDHEIINIGMKQKEEDQDLQYIHTAFLSALLYHTDRAEFIIGGCGTGQGYLNAVLQFPGMFCGHIVNPLDAWLFGQINGGNCISLALNQNYGWAGDVNLEFIFDRLFSVEFGCGYPAERKEPQQASRDALSTLSIKTHFEFDELLTRIDRDIVIKSISYPGVLKVLDIETIKNTKIKTFLNSLLKEMD